LASPNLPSARSSELHESWDCSWRRDWYEVRIGAATEQVRLLGNYHLLAFHKTCREGAAGICAAFSLPEPPLKESMGAAVCSAFGGPPLRRTFVSAQPTIADGTAA
jgi:hypothetical protein